MRENTNKQMIDNCEIDNGTKRIISDCMFETVFDNNSDILMKMLKELFEIVDDKNGTSLSVVGFENVPVTYNDVSSGNDAVVKLSDNSYVYIRRGGNICDNILGENFIQMVRVHDNKHNCNVTYDDLRKYWLTEEILEIMDNGDSVNNNCLCQIKEDKTIDFIYSFCNINLCRCLDITSDITPNQVNTSVRWGAILVQDDIAKIEHILGDDMLTSEEKQRFLKSIMEANECGSVYIGDKCIECSKSDVFYEGVEFGFEDGEEFATAEIIRNMIREGIDYSVISRVTKKAISEIEIIRREMLYE